MAPRPSWPARRSSAPPTPRPQSGRCAPPRRRRNAMDVVDALAHRGRFFRVLQQTERSQTAVMTIAPGEDGGPEEEHAGDQIVYVVEGEAIVRIGDKEHRAAAGSLVMIPARTAHHVKNSGRTPLFFVTVYAPPAY
ncbi:MAG: hypothetical protein DMD75_31225 [Candidatus Rokuibacteriota bacterium]|nr:MAG: hypothetical protein DMD75_31225 [Candidatus Rokubacteria bacterium]